MNPIVFINVLVSHGQRNIQIVLRSKNTSHLKFRPLIVVVGRDAKLNPGSQPGGEHQFEAANDNDPTSPDGVA